MGIIFSLVISYAGVNEAIECIRHIMCGMIPEGDPDFQDLVDYYNKLLHKSSNHNSSATEGWNKLSGQGYLSLSEDDDGKINKAAIKYYDGTTDSTALLFSTKISSFGQESVESVASNQSKPNGDCGSKQSERYTTTKTMVTNTSESFSVGQRNKSPTASYENISDPTLFSGNSFTSNEGEEEEKFEVKEKLTWHYRPLSPVPTLLPEIHFQPYDESANKDSVYPEEFLRLILRVLIICTFHSIPHPVSVRLPVVTCFMLESMRPSCMTLNVHIVICNISTHQIVNLFKIT